MKENLFCIDPNMVKFSRQKQRRHTTKPYLKMENPIKWIKFHEAHSSEFSDSPFWKVTTQSDI